LRLILIRHWLCGDDFKLHVSEVDYIIENSFEMEEINDIPISENERQIAAYVADMIPDGFNWDWGAWRMP
jgi:hypothetical protein